MTNHTTRRPNAHENPHRPDALLTPSEVYGLAVYWSGLLDRQRAHAATLRLNAIGEVLGAAARRNAAEDAISVAEFGADDGMLLVVPRIDRHHDACEEFAPTD